MKEKFSEKSDKTLLTNKIQIGLALLIGLFIPTITLGATLDVDALVTKYADKYGVSATDMIKVIKCESSFNSEAVGDHGLSFGLAQFYMPAKNRTPEGLIITKEMALDPDIALNSMAWYFSNSRQNMWSCWHMIK